MKRRLYSLLLLSVFICSILTACGGSGGAASGPSGSYPSGASKKTKSLQVLAGFIRNPIQHLVLVVADMVATVGDTVKAHTTHLRPI